MIYAYQKNKDRLLKNHLGLWKGYLNQKRQDKLDQAAA